jgi:hypothetical protein
MGESTSANPRGAHNRTIVSALREAGSVDWLAAAELHMRAAGDGSTGRARELARPAVESVRRFVSAATVHLVDAMAGRGALGYEIKAVDPTASGFTGPALTCQARADDTLAILAAFTFAQRGDVVIAATQDFRGSAGVGDFFAAMVRRPVWRPS